MAWHEIFGTGLVKKQKKGIELLHDSDQTPKENVVRGRERGTSGIDMDGGVVNFKDYNTAMQGAEFFNNVDMMRKADGSIKCAALLVKLPLLRTTVQVVPFKDDEEDAQNILIAETTHEKLLGPMAMSESWQQTLRHILLMFDFGFVAFEKVWEVDEDDMLHYDRLAVRLPKTIEGFKVHPDGTLAYILQRAHKDGQSKELHRIPCPTYGAVFSWEKEGDNYFGQSIYRAMYKHWWYKEALYHIDALRLDRWGVGVPKAMIKTGYGVKPSEENLAKRILANLRSNTQSWIMHPEEIEFGILAPAGQGGALGLIDSVNHHDNMIFRSVLTQFISAGNQAFGNYGSVKNYADIFLYAEQAAANFIEEEFTRQIIRPFVDFNFNMALPNGKVRPYPKLKFADVQKIDVKELAEAMARFTSGKIITPDDDLESMVRKLAGWPNIQDGFSREENDMYPKNMTEEAAAAAAAEVSNAAAVDEAKAGKGGRVTSGDSEGKRRVNEPKGDR
jgi:hypothetical protein